MFYQVLSVLAVAAATVAGSPPPGAAPIQHTAVSCVVAGQFPLIEAGGPEGTALSEGRVYFRAGQNQDWYYVEMEAGEVGSVARLPLPRLDASPVRYYIQLGHTETRTSEAAATVVSQATDCPTGQKVAPIGVPGAVTAFAASTSAAVEPVGFTAGGLPPTAGDLGPPPLDIPALAVTPPTNPQ